MTEPWARPPGDRPVVEIELTDNESAPTSRRPPRSPRLPTGPNLADRHPSGVAVARRHSSTSIAFVAFAAVIAIGAAVAVVLSGGDDHSDDASATTIDFSSITTPPTLPSLQLPPPATTSEAGTPGDADGTSATEPGTLPLDPTTITVPVFPVVAGSDGPTADGYDLLAAVAANEPGGTPLRTVVSIEGIQTDGRFTLSADVVAMNDPVAGLDSLVIDRNIGERAEFVVDRASGIVFRSDAGMSNRWEQFTAAGFTDGTGTDSLDELFDSLVRGPITAAAIAAADIEVDDHLVRLDGGAIARRYTATVPLTSIRPYGLLLMANIVDATVESGSVPSTITFEVYVTAGSRLALVATRFESDGIVFLLRQFFDRRPANVIIDLPDPDLIIDGAVTAAPDRPAESDAPASSPPASAPTATGTPTEASTDAPQP